MNLRHFRKHLLTELNNLPDLRSQEIQSYVLTTAILTRRIMEILNHSSLEVPSTYDPMRPAYSLNTILGSFIHYMGFYPRLASLDETQPFVVRLYSHEDRTKGEEYSIKLSDYSDLISRIAKDDIFVVTDLLLPRVITLLNQVIRVQQDFDTDHLNRILALVVDIFELSDSLAQANTIPLPNNVVVTCYEKTSITGLQSGDRWNHRIFTLDSIDLIKGYNTTWQLSPFPPSNKHLVDIDSYGILMERKRQGPSTLPQFFVVPLEEVLKTCEGIKDSVTRTLRQVNSGCSCRSTRS